MPEVISYNSETRPLFDGQTQGVLDLILERFARVEIVAPAIEKESKQWFVQVYRDGNESLPEGFFGDSAHEAAVRIASALGIKF